MQHTADTNDLNFSIEIPIFIGMFEIGIQLAIQLIIGYIWIAHSGE